MKPSRLFLAATFIASSALANHPVLVEGNSDSPSPGTTLVETRGSSGDFDGDGRIGTAEDTDSADRIFGTLNAALGLGTGAAAGTGANQNGKIIIVESGRFAESLTINGDGNTTIEAAPGVEANIDAVLSGDPAAQNGVRQAGTGITISTTAKRVVTLRNLVIRNFATGILINGSSRVNIDNCRFEGCRDFAIRVVDQARVTITNCQVNSTGFRVGSLGDTSVADAPNPGIGIDFGPTARGFISNTAITNSFGVGFRGNPRFVRRISVAQFDNGTGFN